MTAATIANMKQAIRKTEAKIIAIEAEKNRGLTPNQSAGLDTNIEALGRDIAQYQSRIDGLSA